MNRSLVLRDLLDFPALGVPALIEDVEDLLSTRNFFNGLSVSEDDKNVYIEAAVPGVDPKDVDVTFDKGVITIKAEKEEEEKNKKFQRKASSSFYYRVTPENVDLKKEPGAICKNGVIKLTFAKSAEAKPKKIAIKAY